MKSWKARLGLVLTMLAMLLAVSLPAMADDADLDGIEDAIEEELDNGNIDVESVDCSFDDEDDDDDDLVSELEDIDDDNDGTEDFEDLFNDVTCTATFEADDFVDDDDDDDDDE